MPHSDIVIAGAGIIGLSLALELHSRGASVTVLERDSALSHASTAAAGMLAANDPENPAALLPLSHLSLSLYPHFLARIQQLSGLAVPFQTDTTLQFHPSCLTQPATHTVPALTPGDRPFAVLEEHSLDPRQLATALLAAVRNTSIQLHEHTHLHTAHSIAHGIELKTGSGTLHSARLVSTLGAWSVAPTTPRKGQMLSVTLPPSILLDTVLRTPDIYLVPRIRGPRAGHIVIGATVEDAGFDTATHHSDLTHLRSLAAQLLPSLADQDLCPTVDQWAGLRPATPDHLPLLGRHADTPNHLLATGHYRNGILLAPATAQVLAQLLSGEPTTVDLIPFSPMRFPEAQLIAHLVR